MNQKELKKAIAKARGDVPSDRPFTRKVWEVTRKGQQLSEEAEDRRQLLSELNQAKVARDELRRELEAQSLRAMEDMVLFQLAIEQIEKDGKLEQVEDE
jgi:hypothetical protein